MRMRRRKMMKMIGIIVAGRIVWRRVLSPVKVEDIVAGRGEEGEGVGEEKEEIVGDGGGVEGVKVGKGVGDTPSGGPPGATEGSG